MSFGILSGGGVSGVLGAPMETGAGRSVTDGSLGASMAVGPGRAVTDGSLGCASCGTFAGLGSFFGRHRRRGLSGALGETAVSVPTTLILGALLGAAAMYWVSEKKTA